MTGSLASYLCSTAFMKVLRGLYCSSKPRHLRDLSRSCKLSPGGVADILRRLQDLNLVEVQKVKNRKCYHLIASTEEQDLLEKLFHSYERTLVAERTTLLEQGAVQKLKWMDEAYQFFKKVKQKNVNPT